VTTAAGTPLFRVSHLAACYGEVQALWDVSIEGHKGELVVMVGANGAGKTTTIRSIAGMVRATGGTVEFKGESIRGASPSRIVEMGIGHVPEGRALFPHMTVKENLELGAYLPGPRRRWRQSLERVFALFPRLAQRQRQLAGTLSGGEQQMCAIGRGLMTEPSLLILDEPSLGLAPILVDEMFATIAEVQKSGVTVLLVEQHVAQALSLADRAFVIRDGRTVGTGTGAALLADPSVREAYLSV
jgi:branched-chain amino acid transport system ATP-binding protein